jgi:hypothetical protein
MTELVNEVELVATRADVYTVYVFKIVGKDEYIFCTKLPNWQTPEIDVGDIGFLKYQIVNSGDTYYNPDTGVSDVYRYSNIYFMNFVKKSDVVKNKEITL